jgi:3-oxoacyl-[acyl-carrier protein] reductase
VVIADIEPAKKYIDEAIDIIKADGGEAIGAICDVGNYNDAKSAISKAINTWGELNIVMCNAGVLRDKMLFNMTEEEWDTVIRVHLKGHFNFVNQAAAYWRALSKEKGGPVYGRLISTASEAFLYSPPGQPNYAAAKAGITALAMSAAQACIRFGVTSNVILPRARTDMTKAVFAPQEGTGWDEMDVNNVSPLVAYLASPMAAKISGYVFIVFGKMVQVVDAPVLGKKFENERPWTVEDLDAKLSIHFQKLTPIQDGFMVMPS